MSEGVSSLKSHSLCRNSKVAVTDDGDDDDAKVRYRAARAAKNTASGLCGVLLIFVKTFVIGMFQETNQEAFLREVEGGYFVLVD